MLFLPSMGYDISTCDPCAAIAAIGLVGGLKDDHITANDVLGAELPGEKAHFYASVTGRKRREAAKAIHCARRWAGMWMYRRSIIAGNIAVVLKMPMGLTAAV